MTIILKFNPNGKDFPLYQQCQKHPQKVFHGSTRDGLPVRVVARMCGNNVGEQGILDFVLAWMDNLEGTATSDWQTDKHDRLFVKTSYQNIQKDTFLGEQQIKRGMASLKARGLVFATLLHVGGFYQFAVGVTPAFRCFYGRLQWLCSRKVEGVQNPVGYSGAFECGWVGAWVWAEQKRGNGKFFRDHLPVKAFEPAPEFQKGLQMSDNLDAMH